MNDRAASIVMQIDELNDPQAMRLLVLKELVKRAEERVAELERLDLDRPDRRDAIVRVLDEANAYWSLETARTAVPTLDEYREIAEDTYRLTVEQMSGLVVSAMTSEQLRRARAQVIADIVRGPGDDEDGR